MRGMIRRVRARAAGSHPDCFVPIQVPLATWDIFDVGVVDVRQDGSIGIFTTNHNAAHSMLANLGGGRFSEVTTELGLDQDGAFPGWEEELLEPIFSDPGLYLYRRRNAFELEVRTDDHALSVSGELRFACPASVVHQSNVRVDIVDDQRTLGTVVEFSAASDARLTVVPELVALPLSVRVEGLPPCSVFVGPRKITPATAEFVLHLRDRHAMAWADFDGDGAIDVFIARGGLKGRLDRYPGLANDELFSSAGDRFADVSGAWGITKGACRGRQACWVDLAGDDFLSLFVSCAQGPPQLYRRNAAGGFVDVAAEMGLGELRGGSYAWVDVDGDGRSELVVAHRDRLAVYARRPADGAFARTQEVALRGGSGPGRLAIGDWNGDGRPDIFVPSRTGNTLLVNDDGAFRMVDPVSIGLPGRGGVTANWVDYDNDGLVDLHVVPGGLFRQRPDRRFVATGLLDAALPPSVAQARVAWFDAFNDGTRDALVAVAPHPRTKGGDSGWTATLHRNMGAQHHWLQVELRGPRGNRQGIGGAVTVRTGVGSVTQWVGCNDGSHYSQGHYRLYFGLGGHPAADAVEVKWPDGSVQRLGRSLGDQLVAIDYEG